MGHTLQEADLCLIPFSFGDCMPIQYVYTVFASGESSWQLSAAPRQRAGSQRKDPLFIDLDAPPRRCCIAWCKNIWRVRFVDPKPKRLWLWGMGPESKRGKNL